MIHPFNPDRRQIFDFFKYMMEFDNEKVTEAIDLAHNMLLFGIILSYKPKRILEFGIGSGYCTKAILTAIQYNGLGSLTSVDSLRDFGTEPLHFHELRIKGANIIISTEREFVTNCSDEYDLLISDADHKNCLTFLDQTLRVVKSGGLLFFHDTSLNPELLHSLHGLQILHFNQSSRADERCERGWLLAKKT